MTCDRYADKIPEYIRGDLPDAEVEDVRAHVTTCPRCQKEIGDLEWFNAGAKANERRMSEGHIAPRLLYEFVEGSNALEPDTVANIETHLHTCDDCRQDSVSIANSLAPESQVEPGVYGLWRLAGWLRGRPLRPAFVGLALALVVVVSVVLIRDTTRGPTYDVSIITAGMEYEIVDLPLSDLVRGETQTPPSVSLGNVTSNPLAIRLEIDLFEGEELPSTVTIGNDVGEIVREIRVPATSAEAGTILLLLDKTSFAPGRYTVEVLDRSGGSMGWADIDV
jgi:hypothetical protein